MENQTALLSAPDNDTTPALPSATQTTDECKPRTLGQAVESIARGPRTLKQIGTSMQKRIDALRTLTNEEIEQQEKQRAEEQLAFVCRQRAGHWNTLIAERGHRYAECRLSTYEITNPKQREVVDKLTSYGKIATVRDSFGRDDGETESELIRYLTRPEILILSDPLPPAGKLTEFQTNVLFRAIDYPYSRCQPTWVTLNCSGSKEADERMGWQNIEVDPNNWTAW